MSNAIHPSVNGDHPLRHYQLIQELYVLSDACDRSVLGEFDLTVSQYRLLSLLDEEKTYRVTELSNRLLLSKSTITRIVDRLKELGWVVRPVDPRDRRAVQVQITATGLARLQEIRKAHNRSLGVRTRALSRADQHELEVLLDKYRQGLEACFNGGS